MKLTIRLEFGPLPRQLRRSGVPVTRAAGTTFLTGTGDYVSSNSARRVAARAWLRDAQTWARGYDLCRAGSSRSERGGGDPVAAIEEADIIKGDGIACTRSQFGGLSAIDVCARDQLKLARPLQDRRDAVRDVPARQRGARPLQQDYGEYQLDEDTQTPTLGPVEPRAGARRGATPPTSTSSAASASRARSPTRASSATCST